MQRGSHQAIIIIIIIFAFLFCMRLCLLFNVLKS